MKFRLLTFCIFAFGALVNISCPARADDGTMAISGYACETIKDDEAKSTARVRVTDKASFNAVSGLSQLKDYKEQLDSHDFNVMVYGIVDDYIEDLSVKTTEQTDDKICVQINGYVMPQNVNRVVEAFLQQQAEEETVSDDRATETAAELSADITEHLQNEMPETALSEIAAPAAPASAENGSEEPAAKHLSRVYIAPVAFFNNTQSPEHAKIIAEWFEHTGNFETTENPSEATYSIHSKILRAKIDAINNTSNRLQMVVSVELSFADGKDSKTIHQNRFVLFDNTEDEQTAANKLLKKLLYNACEQLEVYMQKDERQNGNISTLPPVITPSGLNQQELEDF